MAEEEGGGRKRLVEQRLEGQACRKGLELQLNVVVVVENLGWLVGGMKQPLVDLKWRVVVGVAEAEAEHHTAESVCKSVKREEGRGV